MSTTTARPRAPAPNYWTLNEYAPPTGRATMVLSIVNQATYAALDRYSQLR